MKPARRIVVASFCLCVSLVFLWVPWTSDAGYSWLWSKPRPRAIQNDMVAEARQRWDAEYRANDLATVGEKWIRAVQQASPEDKDRVKADDEVLNWLDQRENFERTFPEKTNLGESGRKKIIGEWKQVILPAKEWNERIRYASMDYRRIGMELAALTGLFALGLVLTPRRT